MSDGELENILNSIASNEENKKKVEKRCFGNQTNASYLVDAAKRKHAAEKRKLGRIITL